MAKRAIGWAAILVFLMVILVGCGGTHTSVSTPSAPTSSPPSHASGKSAQTKTAPTPAPPKLLSQNELEAVLLWTNDQFNEAYERFQGLQPGTNQQISAEDPGWFSFEGQEARALSAKGDAVAPPQGAASADIANGINPTWCFIQSDVATTTDFALNAVSDMAEYLTGDVSQDQLNSDLSQYQNYYLITLKEVQYGKVYDK